MDLAIVITVVVVALVFDYTNGFHDAANAIATSVSTRALTPRIALILAAVMNFVGALLGQKVAHTVVGRDRRRRPGNEGLIVVLAGLLGAIIWNLLTWYFGLPSSSSHALIGGLVGRGARGRRRRCTGTTVVDKVVIPMVVSPVVGFVLAFVVMIAILWIFRHRNPGRVSRGFRLAQTVSAVGPGARPRPPGRPEDDGRDLPGADHQRLPRARHQDLPLWVIVVVRRRDLARHLLRRLADHAHPGPPDHPPRPAARLRRRVGRRHRALRVGLRLPGARSRRPTSSPRRSWASGATKRFSAVRWGVARSIVDRLGPHLPRRRPRRRPLLRGPRPSARLTRGGRASRPGSP